MKYKIKSILKIISRICMYLCFAVPRSRRIYIFGSWSGQKFSDNSKALFLYALKNTDVKCVWICKNRELLCTMRSKGYQVYMSNSLCGIWYQLRAGVAFSSCSNSDFCEPLLGNCMHVELWHGVGGGKTIGMDDKSYRKYKLSIKERMCSTIESIPLRKHYFVATSSEMKKVFKSAFGIKEDHFIFAGQTRNDMFYDLHYRFETIDKEGFGRKKIILYMPTHRMEGKQLMNCCNLFDMSALNNFCRENDCIFIIKKHFCHREEKEVLNVYENIVDLTHKQIDTNELLLLADCLISDYSSVTADYLLLNRPILYYCFDYEQYISLDRDLYWTYEQITPGPICNTFSELLIEMRKIIEYNEDEFEDERKRVRDMFYDSSCQQKSSQIILDEVSHLLRR